MKAEAWKRLVLIFVSLLSVTVAQAQTEPDFKGKTIRLVIGTSTGGGVDLYARLVGQYLGKHLPGEPVIVAQNMPGASSLVAANLLLRRFHVMRTRTLKGFRSSSS